MKASIQKKDKIMVISFEGNLSFDHNSPLQEQLQELIRDKRRKYQIVFDMKKLDFIGSTGIKDFIKILKEMNKLTPRPRFCGLKSEFHWMFNAFQGRKKFYLYEDEEEAVKSFEV